MKKNSTPSLKQMNHNNQKQNETMPSKRVVDFVRQFARACRTVSTEQAVMRPIILN